jgi:hypothetical protein
MKLKVFVMGAIVLPLVACATPPRFEFGSYEPTLYAYYKKPEMADKYEAALEKAIEKGESSDRLAPGMYAELGYLRLSQGDQAAAAQMFEKEAAAFPESAFFMNRIVGRLTASKSELEAPNQEAAVDAVEGASAESTEAESAPGV